MKEKLKSYFTKYERYVKTFIEAFASYIAVNVFILDLSSMHAWEALLAGAVGSAISVVFNYKNIKQ